MFAVNFQTLAIIVISGILAASMSSADSYMLIMSLATKKPSKEIEMEFSEAKKGGA